jgi:hypothetical protein
MVSSSVSNEDIDQERLASGYLVAPPGTAHPPRAPDTRAEALTPAANLSSTVRDLIAYLRAQFASPPEGPLAANSLREMQRAHWLSESWGSARGLGFGLSRQGDRTLVGHGGWVAGHRSQIAFDPKAEVGVVVLTNSDQGGPSSYVAQLFDYLVPILEREHSAAGSRGDGREIDPELEAFVGRYRDPWGAVTEILSNGRELLVYEHSYPPTDDLAAAVERVERMSGNEFRFSGVRNRPLVFETGDDGRVRRVRTGENYLFPFGCDLRYEELTCD